MGWEGGPLVPQGWLRNLSAIHILRFCRRKKAVGPFNDPNSALVNPLPHSLSGSG